MKMWSQNSHPSMTTKAHTLSLKSMDPMCWINLRWVPNSWRTPTFLPKLICHKLSNTCRTLKLIPLPHQVTTRSPSLLKYLEGLAVFYPLALVRALRQPPALHLHLILNHLVRLLALPPARIQRPTATRKSPCMEWSLEKALLVGTSLERKISFCL